MLLYDYYSLIAYVSLSYVFLYVKRFRDFKSNGVKLVLSRKWRVRQSFCIKEKRVIEDTFVQIYEVEYEGDKASSGRANICATDDCRLFGS